MARTGLAIWCNVSFEAGAAEILRAGTAKHQFTFANGDNASLALASADIALGQPDPEAVMASSRLQWVHITSAGYTRYDNDEFRNALQSRGAMFTNSSHVYDEPCAQHVLAMMLALARQLPQSYETQRTDKSWPGGERRANSYLLNGQTVLLLGYGAIGRRLVELLAPFKMNIIAVRRNAQDAAGVKVITEAALNEVLPLADHVVNILPDNSSTMRFVNAQRLSLCKRGALLYNVGRGTTVDQEALMRALETGHIGAAYLDVTDLEPLLPSHPLWNAPNCFITPHTAGGHKGEQERLVRHFLDNLAAFENDTPLQDRVI
ncbi:MAG: D-2-hydroxyacid dehydrogenase [Abitibacteriaceae bacterium]|nr:D-2-hydroxyacid dehydrogenase [Abditibacteriaceae bacterium]MBV9866415.1 D-2-hydroxyacid dehydrogenase [Abditibacteriaceae bacterium]